MKSMIEDLTSLNKKTLNEFSEEELVDISGIEIDRSLAKKDRILKYLEDVKNPYFFKVGDVTVHVKFSENSMNLQDRILRKILQNSKCF